MRHRKAGLLSFIALLVLILGLSACAGQSATPPTPTPAGGEGAGAQATPESAAEPEPSETVEATPTVVAEPEPEATTAADSAQGEATGGTITVYSGRSEELVGPIIQRFTEETGIQVEVRWGGTSELAATLLEEGTSSPADVFFAQDPGGLGVVADMMAPLPEDILERVDPRFRDPEGRWTGISGRARVVVYNTERLQPEDLPEDLSGFTDPEWEGRIGWAPTNASFQTMVTGMRVMWGEDQAREWLEGILLNEPVVYPNNSAIVAAVGAGEIDVGFVNHYYLYRYLAEEGEDFPARNYYLPSGGPGSLVMVAGAAVLSSSQEQEAAQEFIRFLLSQEAQQYFADQTYEYPLVEGVETHPELTPLDELTFPEVELADLADLDGTARLLSEVGALP